MVYAHQIREVLSAFLDSGNGQEFVVELEKLTFDIERHGEPEAIRLTRAIRDIVARASVGHIDRKQLTSEFRALLSADPYCAIGEAPASMKATGGTDITCPPVEQGTWVIASVDIGCAREFAQSGCLRN